jgi:hypothetical protein
LDILEQRSDGVLKPDALGKDHPLRVTLSVLLKEAGDDREKLKKQIEVWFENSMERVSGWYKRHTQAVSLVLAAVVTILANADSIVIAKALWNDTALRQAVVRRAEKYVESNTPSADTQGSDDTAPPPPPLPPDLQADVDFDRASRNLDAALADLNELQLPLGWETPRPSELRDCLAPPAGRAADARESAATRSADEAQETGNVENARLVPENCLDDWPGSPFGDRGTRWGAAMMAHLGGWMITILAVSLGSPFWFDMLNKVMSIRSAGKAPEEAQKRPKVLPKAKAAGEEEDESVG